MVRMAASLKKLEQDSNIEKEAKKLIKGTLNLNVLYHSKITCFDKLISKLSSNS